MRKVSRDARHRADAPAFGVLLLFGCRFRRGLRSVRAVRCSPPSNPTDTDDGNVTIMGISDKAALVLRDTLRMGDWVVSVESSVGATMWEVSTTDGLTSAVTARLPGQPVCIVFERVDADAIRASPGVA